MREGRGRARAAYLALAGSLIVAAGSLVEAVRDATLARVGLLIGGALAPCVVGVALEASARATRLPALPSGGGGSGGYGAPGMSPDEVLRRYPRATLRWLRGRLGLSHEAFAAHIHCNIKSVSEWEARRHGISRECRAQLAALLAPHLATAEGAAFARSLGRGKAAEG